MPGRRFSSRLKVAAPSEAGWCRRTPASKIAAGTASGGGFSQQFARPSYQDGVAGPESARGVPDVSADADPALAPAVALTIGRQYAVRPAGGTPAAAAIWAGLIALAAAGWNPVTGWGSPNAPVLIPLLVRYGL
jgi:subtilase family serine protease